eukprot:585309-Pyramimonas_sp.AAC.1
MSNHSIERMATDDRPRNAIVSPRMMLATGHRLDVHSLCLFVVCFVRVFSPTDQGCSSMAAVEKNAHVQAMPGPRPRSVQ